MTRPAHLQRVGPVWAGPVLALTVGAVAVGPMGGRATAGTVHARPRLTAHARWVMSVPDTTDVAGYVWTDKRRLVWVTGGERQPGRVDGIDVLTGARRPIRQLTQAESTAAVRAVACEGISPDGRWFVGRPALPSSPRWPWIAPRYVGIRLADGRTITWPDASGCAGIVWTGRDTWAAFEHDRSWRERVVFRSVKSLGQVRSVPISGPACIALGVDADGRLLAHQAFRAPTRVWLYRARGGMPIRTFTLPAPASKKGAVVAIDPSGTGYVLQLHGPGHGDDFWYGLLGGPSRYIGWEPWHYERHHNWPSFFRFRPDGRVVSFIYDGALWRLRLPRLGQAGASSRRTAARGVRYRQTRARTAARPRTRVRQEQATGQRHGQTG